MPKRSKVKLYEQIRKASEREGLSIRELARRRTACIGGRCGRRCRLGHRNEGARGGDSNRRRTTKYASPHSARDLQIDEETDADEQLPQQPSQRVTEFLNPTRDPGGSRIPMR